MQGRGRIGAGDRQSAGAVNHQQGAGRHESFSRAHDILAAKANKALDSAENPDEMLDYSYEQMLDYITRVRQALVEIAAERKRIELQEPQLQHTIAHLETRPRRALGQGREDLAREALSRRAAAQQQAGGWKRSTRSWPGRNTNSRKPSPSCSSGLTASARRRKS